MFHIKTQRLFPCFAFALAACGATGTMDGDGNGQAADSGAVGRADANNNLNFTDASCGAQTEEIPLVEINDPPDLLIVLDKSGSMDTPPGFPFPFSPTKWDIMEDALNSITSTYNNNIRFGLSVFPNGGPNLCGVLSGADVPVDLGQAPAISSWLAGNSPNGNTPAHLALQNASSIYAGLPANPAGQYVLFATDGVPNCGGTPPVPDQGTGTETVAAVQALAAQGVNTFVLGFGDVLGLDPGVLNDAAQAGGEAKPGGPPYYYAANDANSLQTALMQIAGGIILPSCSFTVSATPPDPNLVTVTVNGTPIPRDPGHNNGWDYHPDASTITFFGMACEQVQTGNTEVSFVFGCPGPTIE